MSNHIIVLPVWRCIYPQVTNSSGNYTQYNVEYYFWSIIPNLREEPDTIPLHNTLNAPDRFSRAMSTTTTRRLVRSPCFSLPVERVMDISPQINSRFTRNVHCSRLKVENGLRAWERFYKSGYSFRYNSQILQIGHCAAYIWCVISMDWPPENTNSYCKQYKTRRLHWIP